MFKSSKICRFLGDMLEKFVSIADDTKLEKIDVANLTESMSPLNCMGARLLKRMKPLPLPHDKRFYSWKQFFRNARSDSRTCHDANAPAVITYTGGTTDGSKGAILSSKAVNALAQQYLVSERNLHRESTWMQVLPLFIAYGVTSSMMIALAVGMTQIIRIPMVESIAEFCKKFKPNHVLYGPAYGENLLMITKIWTYQISLPQLPAVMLYALLLRKKSIYIFSLMDVPALL
ncbi:MAG: AMP-binding protein [Lachnospiraceae bacterium]|nr:AMP-binding protein [Lachnospiraceae bacterium]